MRVRSRPASVEQHVLRLLAMSTERQDGRGLGAPALGVRPDPSAQHSTNMFSLILLSRAVSQQFTITTLRRRAPPCGLTTLPPYSYIQHLPILHLTNQIYNM